MMTARETYKDRTLEEVRQLAAERPLRMITPLDGDRSTRLPQEEAQTNVAGRVVAFLAQLKIQDRLEIITELEAGLTRLRADSSRTISEEEE